MVRYSIAIVWLRFSGSDIFLTLRSSYFHFFLVQKDVTIIIFRYYTHIKVTFLEHLSLRINRHSLNM